jgi:hypothetical protein
VVHNKLETVEHVFWNRKVDKTFWAWVAADYNVFFVSPVHWNSVVTGIKWMVWQAGRAI